MTTVARYYWLVARGALRMAAVHVAVFSLAGRLNYWQGWVWAAANLLTTLIVATVFRDTPDLIEERVRPGPGIKRWDRILMGLYSPIVLAIPGVAALDAGRFGWSPPWPWPVYCAGCAGLGLSYGLALWSMRTNRFFSSMVRIQAERGHHVVQAGPYRVVRHPGYVGFMLGAVSVAVVLGSRWALIPATLMATVLVVRTALEDAALRQELPGYAQYAVRVKYRLLPGVW